MQQTKSGDTLILSGNIDTSSINVDILDLFLKNVLTLDKKYGIISRIECVAQPVEHLTFNQVAEGSNPSALTNKIKDLHKNVGP